MKQREKRRTERVSDEINQQRQRSVLTDVNEIDGDAEQVVQ